MNGNSIKLTKFVLFFSILSMLNLWAQNAEGQKKEIYFENPVINNSNAILEELEAFSDAIEGKNTPLVSLENGTEALNIAFQIIKAYS